MTVLAIIIGPLAVLAGAALNHLLSGRAADKQRQLDAEAARLSETRHAILDFLRTHSNAVATARKMALLVEARAPREEALAQLDIVRSLSLDMDMAVAQVEWVAPQRIIEAARKASDGVEPAMGLFDRIGTRAKPTVEEWNDAHRSWVDARRKFMVVCRREFYGEDTPPLTREAEQVS